MRVIHLIKATGIAGAEKHILDLLPGLRRNEIDARLWILEEPGNPMTLYEKAAAERRIPTRRFTIYGDADISLYPRLSRRLHHAKPDILHTHLLHADLFGIPSARMAKVPKIVTTRHNIDAFRRRSPIRQINRYLWQKVDAGISVSQAVARFSIEEEGAPAEIQHVVLHGIEAPPLGEDRMGIRHELGLNDDQVVIGMVGRLTEQKGVRYGLQAFARVIPGFTTVQLVVVGDGPLCGELKREAVSLGINDHVHFLGWREHAERTMRAFDIFLMPSLWEGFGIVLLEAMGRELPVVASRVDAIPEIVREGETGFLVAARNVKDLQQRLSRLLADAGLRMKMGRAGRKVVETEFTISRMVENTLEVYRQA
ncbi:MAG: glycosyltransferase [Candidatus Eisenbacteria bacterium]|uniref:Glycosyltransferase n=1 Tax=Eiseniibacteriota bacterium TaxID=2212470 RepID=A0A948RWI4_UNCEI|nr:glycosyltransferase [Candidatus Eisenbacteria bacterium]MBU1949694.1 glycosyltransferase [Candidatus Eisenbacteria bacterium]MBU2692313.1 glycosyltransferase [Candidatus Eisenbacteria bacterium]